MEILEKMVHPVGRKNGIILVRPTNNKIAEASVINMRDEPSVKGKKVSAITKGEKVELVE